MRFLAIFLSLVAAYWWTIGVFASNASPVLYGVPFIMGALIIVTAFRRKQRAVVPSGGWRRFGIVLGIATGFEGAAFLAAFAFLPAMQRSDVSASVSAIIVGLHFVLLARLIPARIYDVTGAFLTGLGATGFAIGNAGLHVQYVCLGGAVTFWITYGMMLRIGDRRRRRCAGEPACA
jgi:hypothetical protein